MSNPVNNTKIAQRDAMSVSEYRQAKNDEFKDLRNKALADLASKEKDEIDEIYNYRVKKLNAENALYEKSLKAKVALQAKYGLIDGDGNPKQVSKRIEAKYKKELKEYEKFLAAKKRADEKAEANAYKRELALAKSAGAQTVRGGKLLDWTMWKQFGKATTGLSGGAKFGAIVDGLVSGLSDFAKKLDNTIDNIGNYQSRWDTRLYGYSGNDYQQMSRIVTGAAGVSPLVKQSDIMKNIDTLIDKGIAYNVEQRAFLNTISDKIATTFDAANGTLLQLVRIQQADSTASRLGLEAGVTQYLNNMFSSSEYMTDLYKTVTGNLYEATSQYSAQNSIGFEYQAQKWLGSLYSLGMSSNAISNISSALGALGSGNLNGLSGGMQNLMVMAASKAGLSYSDLLTKGLSASSTNSLMAGLVSYLSDISNSSNNVVKSQYANIFGLSLSDLKAISNVGSSFKSIYNSNMDYNSSLSTLNLMANSIGKRMGIGEMMTNMWDNTQYSMASGIATNPVLYAIYKAAGLLDSVAGGIALKDIKYLGSGVNLQTTVADLMRVGSLSGGILSSIGAMISGSGGGGITGKGLFDAFGINGTTTVTRGTGRTFTDAGVQTSLSNYVANSSGEDITGSYTTAGEDEGKQKIEAMAEEDNSKKIDDVCSQLDKIIQILGTDGIIVKFSEPSGNPENNPSGF